ncbi:hypothetical protein SUGI_0131060 [Cryptomeria japonica]|uniref:probable pectinesterase 53 n=1 Tax=Cryptomeria japonica TaxID=3369 RepID=UPI002408E7BB|nr:probable pectinesterase 53 [Cryptomeria japonica]GLJ10580.1 hypothetical protein SUGI_0131060 [Cryptomeria japonica]
MAAKMLFKVVLMFMVVNCFSWFGSGWSFERHKQSALEEVKKDYDEWISWQILQRSSNLGYNVRDEDRGSSSLSGLEKKLREAEKNKRVIIVCPSGRGDFTTIRDAVHSIDINNTRRTVVYIKAGIYREKILVPRAKPFVTFVGDESEQPIITGNDTASTVGKDGQTMKTFHSATVAVNSDYFIAYNIRFENTAPYPEEGSEGGQAVALRISGSRAAFYNCSFYGTQDTLYDHKGLHYFKSCFIQGSMDFIFGYGRSLYANCLIQSIAKGVAALTAQKRSRASMASGFSFLNCRITGSGLVYLGRAWGDHSRVIFGYTYMDSIVLPEGWNDWGCPEREKTVYYAQYKCRGPGANTTGRVQWGRILSAEEASPFFSTSFIRGTKWLMGNPSLSLLIPPLIC